MEERTVTEVWETALHDLKGRVSSENYENWLAPVRCGGLEGDTLLLRIPNRFYADWISSHYLDVILSSLRGRLETQNIRVQWQVDESLARETLERARKSTPPEATNNIRPISVRGATGSPSASPAAYRAEAHGHDRSMDPSSSTDLRPSQVLPAGRPSTRPPAMGSATNQSNAGHAGNGHDAPRQVTGLNPKYSFDNFVVGPSNQLAHAASVAAASGPGRRYNPLFLYGGVGLGKTHLVNAIGHRILQDQPGARILYVSAERFTNEYIWALQNHKMTEFHERYRNQCDALLMDDIQFLAGKEQTQEAFFHTFNALYHSDRQIVVTSDVFPQHIPEMEERLISRFQWGMVADIQAPALDTRVAIVRKKAELERIELSDDVALFLAQIVKSNVRELEGTLLRLAVKAELMNRRIDLEFAKEALRNVMPRSETATTVDDVQRAVCDYFSIRLAELKSHRRQRSITHPRMIAMYLCKQRLGLSYPELGNRFGGRDHTTVMSAVRKITGLIEEDARVRSEVEAIERKLGM